jgi:sigma-B regulation protein RsbU (phosphoserine phosphatase)
MIAAPIPAGEAERLEALHALHVLDTAPEERFDRITRMLTRIFGVPIAYVSLIDSDRQWFKSSCGLDGPQTSRDISFCAHAILSDEALIIPDALADRRFADSPLVIGPPHVRFYAGQPLAGPGGQKIGTLCIADRKPRRLEESELETLRELARVVERELNLSEAVQLQKELLALKDEAAQAEREKLEYLNQMLDSQHHLVRELEQAVRYVRSLLPEPLGGPVRTRWQFMPCSQLGGDCFGYFWIDRDHFAVYLLDVCGHGVGAALLSVSVTNTLRAQALPDTDFRDPVRVLAGLNDAFLMEKQDGKYFTIWYGVYNQRTRRLDCASAGHPPAVLLLEPEGGRAKLLELGENNLVIGVAPGESFRGAGHTVGPRGRLYLFSDGVFEVEKPDGSMMQRSELTDYLREATEPPGPEEVWGFVQQVAGSKPLKDDFSLVEVQFPEEGEGVKQRPDIGPPK